MFEKAKVGDIVEYGNPFFLVFLHVVKSEDLYFQCDKCYFHRRYCRGIACLSIEREDGNSVYFVEYKSLRE